MKIHIIANKNFELEPLINAFLTRKIYQNIGLPDAMNWPSRKTPIISSYRAIFSTNTGHNIKLSCVQDYILDSRKEKSSEYKYEVAIPAILDKDDSELIVCFGTAGYPEKVDINGSVAVGHKFFIYNAKTDNPESKLSLKEAGQVFGTASSAITRFYEILLPEKEGYVISAFLQRVPINPSKYPTICAKDTNVALSIINITNYDDYYWADREGLKQFLSSNNCLRASSVETTHGLIASRANLQNIPVMWTSAIANREGFFDFEVTPMQNYLSSYNAGMALAKAIDVL
jgi:hypothetical protein